MNEVVKPVASFQCRKVPRIYCESPDKFRDNLSMGDTPIIVTGLVDKWPAHRKWSLDYLRTTFGNMYLRVAVRLPINHSPYAEAAAGHIEEMSLSAALDLIENSEDATYVRRQHLEKFSNTSSDIEIAALSPKDGQPKNYFIWIGKNTLTGLHFDLTQGMLCQLIGEKRVYLASPLSTKFLSPLPGSVTKSEFLPSRPDFVTFPRAQQADFWSIVLHPGELLVIPRLWWHSVVSSGVSVSVSHDFGRMLSNRELLSIVTSGGTQQVARVARDFVYHGILKRPYVRRLTDDPPFGQLIYDMMAYSIKRRLSM